MRSGVRLETDTVFDLSFFKLFVLAVLAVVIFGPEQLPKIAAQAGRTLRELRKIADGARDDIREGLGPEFADFDVADLNPRHFVQRHLLDGLDGLDGDPAEAAAVADGATPAPLDPGEKPPYDTEAT